MKRILFLIFTAQIRSMRYWLQKYREDYSATIKIGIPIVLGQLGIVIVGLVDNIMVGHFSTSDLAAASFVNSVFNIPILFGMGFSYGFGRAIFRAR